VSARLWAPCAIAAAACAAIVVAPASAASSGSTVKACANKKTGALRLVVGKKGCSKRERRVSLSSIGPGGPKGDPGSQGAAGAQGPVGPQGPGAKAFTQVTAQDGTQHRLFDTGDQTVSGYCAAGVVEVIVAGTAHGSNPNPLDVSGFGTSGSTVTPHQSTGIASTYETNASNVSLDVLLRSEDTGKISWLKVFGQQRASDCRFWGMWIPTG
jgi:hypothetical protein